MNRHPFGRLKAFLAIAGAIIFCLGVPSALTYGIHASHNNRAEAFRERIIDAGYTITHESDGYDGRINFRIKVEKCEFYLHHPRADGTFDLYKRVKGKLIGKSEREQINDITGAIRSTYQVPYSTYTLETFRDSKLYKQCDLPR